MDFTGLNYDIGKYKKGTPLPSHEYVKDCLSYAQLSNNKDSLQKVYNKAIDFAIQEDVQKLVLVHDDVILENYSDSKLDSLFEKFDVIGCAGTTEVKLINNDTLLVKIKDLGADRMNQLAQRFLTEINNIGGKTLDKFRLKPSFNVELEE